jgi:hypothetical protein
MYDLEMTTLGLSIELGKLISTMIIIIMSLIYLIAANNMRTRNFNRLIDKLLDLLKQIIHQKYPE